MSKAPQPARQYLIDRSDGKSYGGGPDVKKPPLPCCYVPPCVKWCQCLEVNPILPCWLFGKVGFTSKSNDDESFKTRRNVMSVGLIANLIGMALTFFSCFALSRNYELIETASFSSGTVTPNVTNYSSVDIDIGLLRIAVDNPNTVGQTVVGFDEFCDLFNEGLERYIAQDSCSDCEDASESYAGSLISTMVLYLPSIFTDFTRMFPAYDVNCQKFFSAIIALISMVLTGHTLRSYREDCFNSFYDGTVNYFANFTPVPEGYECTGADCPEIVNADFDWDPGNGFICLLVATVLKGVDVICHFLIPTPSITRNKEEQEEYQRLYGPDATATGEAEENAGDKEAPNSQEDEEANNKKDEQGEE